ncbi:BatD family protein [Vibrio ezurae]|uniref:BatD protein n=1 Tax=Vibrio ezurae NBRC 102218 TaxID=1219080 RepID=U3AJS0_9VIBR|nr:BatD family protein [Vibrio ezurae]GAD80171.1 hypothetical protein VEZ01S_26_00090 [Vibrio ezurae NBRC 102218]
MIKFKSVITSLAFTAGLLCSFSSWALNITASVNKTTVTKDEIIQLKVSADEKLDSDSIDLNTLSDDFYVSRPSFGSSVNIMNGKRTDSSVWTVSIAPRKTGTLTIPAFTIKEAKTSPISLTVTANAQAPKTKDLIEIRTKLDRKELYPNESTILNTRIIVKVDPRLLQNPSLTPPKATGLQLDPLAEPKQYQAVVNGVESLIIEQAFRVTGKASGDFTINAPTLSGVVRYGNRQGNSHLISLDDKPQQVAIKILPIPENYHGQWLPTSKLELSQHWQLDNNKPVTKTSVTINAGDSLTRTINVTAAGLTSAQLPNLTIENPDAFRVYNEKPSFVENDNGSISMNLKQVLIAKHSGEYTLPDVTLQWWNSRTKQAQTSHVDGLNVIVKPGDNPEVAVAQPQSIPPSNANNNAKNPSSNMDTHINSGIWPTLTAIFAGLWLLSTIMWLRARKQTSTPEQVSIKSEMNDNLKAQLIKIVQQGDSIKAQAILERWLKTEDVKQDDIKMIREQITIMNQALIGKEPNDWDCSELIKLIKNARCNEIRKDSYLAKL